MKISEVRFPMLLEAKDGSVILATGIRIKDTKTVKGVVISSPYDDDAGALPEDHVGYYGKDFSLSGLRPYGGRVILNNNKFKHRNGE